MDSSSARNPSLSMPSISIREYTHRFRPLLFVLHAGYLSFADRCVAMVAAKEHRRRAEYRTKQTALSAFGNPYPYGIETDEAHGFFAKDSTNTPLRHIIQGGFDF